MLVIPAAEICGVILFANNSELEEKDSRSCTEIFIIFSNTVSKLFSLSWWENKKPLKLLIKKQDVAPTSFEDIRGNPQAAASCKTTPQGS